MESCKLHLCLLWHFEFYVCDESQPRAIPLLVQDVHFESFHTTHLAVKERTVTLKNSLSNNHVWGSRLFQQREQYMLQEWAYSVR